MKIISSIYGKVSKLLVSIPNGGAIAQAHVQELHAAFDDGRDFRLIAKPQHTRYSHPLSNMQIGNLNEGLYDVGNGRDIFILEVCDAMGLPIEDLEPHMVLSHSEWVQDPFCVLEHSTQVNPRGMLLQPIYSGTFNDRLISMQLAADSTLDFAVKPTGLVLEGGNILAADDYALVGIDLLAKNYQLRYDVYNDKASNAVHLKATKNDIARALGMKRLIWIGSPTFRRDVLRKDVGSLTYQPAFHIDLFLTLGGKAASGKELLFFGSPKLANELIQEHFGQGATVATASIVDEFEYHLDLLREMSGKYQDDILVPDFEIVPIPLLVFQQEIYPFNNGIVEIYDGTKAVYLPTYEFAGSTHKRARLNEMVAVLKLETTKLFRAHGFQKVHWVGPGDFYRRNAQRKGSLNCLTKVLERS